MEKNKRLRPGKFSKKEAEVFNAGEMFGKFKAEERILNWLKENTKGLKKGFDKYTLIFSYNDIKYDLINYLKEKQK